MEIIGANKTAKFLFFHHDEISLIPFQQPHGNTESSPAIGDDNMVIYENSTATTMGLKVMDIKTEFGPKSHGRWRGNRHRSVC